MKKLMRLNRRDLGLLPLPTLVAGSNAFAAEATSEHRYNRPQETVDYSQAPRGKVQCDTCKLFRPAADGRIQGCLVVANSVVASGSCVLHKFPCVKSEHFLKPLVLRRRKIQLDR